MTGWRPWERGRTAEKPEVRLSIRIAAKIVDLVLVFALGALVIWPLGPMLGFLYSVAGDGLPLSRARGQSVGKILFGIQVIHERREEPGTLKESIFRNAPVGVATFFGMIPVAGWIIMLVLGGPLMIMEIYLMARAPKGRRLGDVMGNTEVVFVAKT